MERVTSKTHDAYVEFVSLHEATKAVERHTSSINRGKPGRLGDRPVEVELSSQAALMKDLFPLAAGVVWHGAQPHIQMPIPGQPWATFKGFITEEEMTMLVKHVEIPQRVSPSNSAQTCELTYDVIVALLARMSTTTLRVHDQYHQETTMVYG